MNTTVIISLSVDNSSEISCSLHNCCTGKSAKYCVMHGLNIFMCNPLLLFVFGNQTVIIIKNILQFLIDCFKPWQILFLYMKCGIYHLLDNSNYIIRLFYVILFKNKFGLMQFFFYFRLFVKYI